MSKHSHSAPHKGKKRKALPCLPAVKALFFVLAFVHFELTLKFSTSKLPHNINLLYILLAAAAVGLIVFVLVSLIPARAARIVIPVILFIIGIAFYVLYLSYREYLIFYDLETMANGAGGVFGQFMGESMRLVLNFAGLSRMVLFLLPAALSAIFFRPLSMQYRLTVRSALLCVVLAVLCLGGQRALIAAGPYKSAYSEEYNYNTAVSDFGLLTSFRLDVQKLLFGSSRISFHSKTESAVSVSPEYVVGTPTPEPTDETASAETAEEDSAVPTGNNELDIDFIGLELDSSGTVAQLANYCAGLTASNKNEYTGLFEGKNLIFLTCEAFSLEAVSEELTPTLYRLMTKGINFTDYYQPSGSGTTGGEYQNIFGILPMSGGASMDKTIDRTNYTTISYMLNELGYYGRAYHNNDYTYYDRDQTHNNLGFSDGFIGYGSGVEDYVTAAWPESDDEMILGSLSDYIDNEPFCIYYMTVSGHSSYSYNSNDQAQANWDLVEDLPYSEKVKAYLAANIELENALNSLVTALEDAGIADDTVIVMSPDHFPYGLDDDASLGNMPYLSELYGYDVETSMQRDHSVLIIWSECLEDEDPIVVDSPVSSLDILPTLLNLFGLDFDSRLYPGRDVFSDAEAIVFNAGYEWVTDLGSYSGGVFTPSVDESEIPDDYVDSIREIVSDKVSFCEAIQYTDFYGAVYESLQ